MTHYTTKPSSPQEALAHYGVLGMKWGKTRAKANARQIRKARRNLARKAADYHDEREAIKGLKTKTEKRAAKDKLGEMKTDFLKDPDRVIASRLTRGEKAAVLILGLGVGGGTALATTSAVSRRIERKQETGAYDN